jgi:hypothetical protein
MQKNIVGRTGEDVSPSNRRRSGVETFRRYPEQAKNHSLRKIYRSGFLKQSLPIIPAKPDENDTSTEYLSKDNFYYLWECAVHYAGLLGKTIELTEGTIHEKFCLLYHRFAAILPKKQRLNIELEDNRLRWVVYKYHNWSDRTFYWMPLKFIAMLSGQIREIAMSFMSLFIRKNGLSRFKNGYEFDFFFEWAAESLHCSDYDELEIQANHELLESYDTGEISVFLDEVYDHKPLDVVSALKEYSPANPLETKLIGCFRKGLRFITGENCIMDYHYDPNSEYVHDDYDDTPPVTINRIIRCIYDTDDFITFELEDMTNRYMQETYALEPISFLILQPDSKLFITDDYPEKFAEWFSEMVNITKEIT